MEYQLLVGYPRYIGCSLRNRKPSAFSSSLPHLGWFTLPSICMRPSLSIKFTTTFRSGRSLHPVQTSWWTSYHFIFPYFLFLSLSVSSLVFFLHYAFPHFSLFPSWNTIRFHLQHLFRFSLPMGPFWSWACDKAVGGVSDSNCQPGHGDPRLPILSYSTGRALAIVPMVVSLPPCLLWGLQRTSTMIAPDALQTQPLAVGWSGNGTGADAVQRTLYVTSEIPTA